MKTHERNIKLPSKRIEAFSKKAELYSRRIAQIASKAKYEVPESALAIAGDEKQQSGIQKQIEHLKGARHIILVGIGGSSLGTEAVYRALALRTSPRLHVFDAIDEEALGHISQVTDAIETDAELAVVIVSKSGTTTETMTNAVSVLDALEAKHGKDILDRVVFVGSEKTDFVKIGKKKKITCVTFPRSIGGRYSVFSAAGIVPLSLLSIDIAAFLEGACDAMSTERRKQTVTHAITLAVLAEDGMHTVNFFTFNKRLRMLGYWYRQLLAESVGKTMTTHGATFSHQLLPTTSTAVDLHSMAQLYLGGYQDFFTHFVYADTHSDYHKLTNHWLLEVNAAIDGHTPQEVREAIRKGVLKAYDEHKLPYRTTMLPKISAYEMGLFMSSLMFEVMCLCHLFDVDAFTQPNVESYKSFTREILMK